MPSPIIERRVPDQPCCGRTFVVSDIIYGRGTTPCIEYPTEVLTNGDLVIDPGGSGLTALNWLHEPFTLGLAGYDSQNAFFHRIVIGSERGADFQNISLDPLNTYTLTYFREIIQAGVDAVFSIILQTPSSYYEHSMLGQDGVITVTINPGDWIAGTHPSVSGYTGSGGPNFIMIEYIANDGSIEEWGLLHWISLTYPSCIAPCANTQVDHVTNGAFDDPAAEWTITDLAFTGAGIVVAQNNRIEALNVGVPGNIYQFEVAQNFVSYIDTTIPHDLIVDTGQISVGAGGCGITQLILTIQSGTFNNPKFFSVDLTGEPYGTFSVTINPGDWTAGGTVQAWGSASFQVMGFNDVGAECDEYFIDNFHLLYIDCI